MWPDAVLVRRSLDCSRGGIIAGRSQLHATQRAVTTAECGGKILTYDNVYICCLIRQRSYLLLQLLQP